MITKHKTVMIQSQFGGGQMVVHFRQDVDPGEVPEMLDLSREVWLEMGSPDKITVSVKAGDTLN